jgi:hypothetical protein
MQCNAYTNYKSNPGDPQIFVDVHADFPQAAEAWRKLIADKDLVIRSISESAGSVRIILGFAERVPGAEPSPGLEQSET